MIIAFEGTHGCGKSTQIDILRKKIEETYRKSVLVSSWNSYPGLSDFNNYMKLEGKLDNLSFSLIHALDFRLRYIHDIKPHLESGGISIVDRYKFTSIVRDTIRGVNEDLINDIYKDIPDPDITFFFQVNELTALNRIKNIEKRSPYVLGKDIYPGDTKTSFLRFMKEQNEKYLELISFEENGIVIDASQDINNISREIFKNISERIGNDFDRKRS